MIWKWSEVLQPEIMQSGCIDRRLCWWCVRSVLDMRIIYYRSMRNDSMVIEELYIKAESLGVGGFPCLLSVLVLLYSKGSYDFEIALTLVLS